MRNVLVTGWIVVLFSTLSVLAQTPKDNLYARGLKACLGKELSEYAKFSRRDLRNVIILADEKITRELGSQFGEIKVEYLSLPELARRYATGVKTHKDKDYEIPVIEISPIFDEGENLIFAYRNSWFSYHIKKGSPNYSLALEGGCRGKISFDQASKRYEIGKVELWGI